jgi:hypothetical protein
MLHKLYIVYLVAMTIHASIVTTPATPAAEPSTQALYRSREQYKLTK